MWSAISFSVAQEKPQATTNNAGQDSQVVSILKEMATLRSQISSAKVRKQKPKRG